MDNETTFDGFDGVFYFSNWTSEDFTAFWNNEEYLFPKNTTSPLIMPKETLENVQEIRKKFAYKLATREFYKGNEYKRLVKMGNKSAGGTPPLFDEKILEPMIEACLKPLPKSKAKVKKLPPMDDSHFTSKAFDEKAGLGTVNESFKDAPVKTLGKMADTPIS